MRITGAAEALEVAVGYPNAVVVTDSGDRFGAAGWRVGAGGDGGVTALALEEARTASTAAMAQLAAAKVAAEEALVALDGGDPEVAAVMAHDLAVVIHEAAPVPGEQPVLADRM